ncbi:MAG: formylglycine-generating enzyme family protein [Candidatus Latescibacterota bacterium]|nr:formylglycine-generating enzyme family protein [Candidatus Latescibacterota bacterium]
MLLFTVTNLILLSSYAEGSGSADTTLTDMVRIDNFYIDKYEFPNQANHFPTVDVTFTQAQSICRQVGKRLCSEQEWQRAATGPENYLYGYGNTFESGRCNTPFLQSSYWKSGRSLAQSGSFPLCCNSYGLYDMIGNVWEWTNGWHSQSHQWRVVRGGSYFNSANMARSDSRYGQFLDEQFHLDLIGFRCCKSVSTKK